MTDLILLLLEEWHQRKDDWNQICPQCLIFGSFADWDTLELLVFLSERADPIIPNSDFFLSSPYTHNQPPIIAILFPLHKTGNLTAKYRGQLEKILKYSNSELKRRLMRKLQEKSLLFLMHMQTQDQLQQQLAQEKNDTPSMRLKRIFGEIPANYLQEIVFFPKILLKQWNFNGIPLHYSTEQFVNQMLFPEMVI